MMRNAKIISPLARLAAGAVLTCTAFAGVIDEYEVKAAFLYNFAKFVEWPPVSFKTERDPMHICVLGADPFGNSLAEVLKGKTVLGRPIALAAIPDAGQASNCQIVFIGSSERKRMRTILKALPSTGILTVGETDGFAQHGGMVNFTRENGRVRFEINPDLAADARLRISSRVLQLARIVKSETVDTAAIH